MVESMKTQLKKIVRMTAGLPVIGPFVRFGVEVIRGRKFSSSPQEFKSPQFPKLPQTPDAIVSADVPPTLETVSSQACTASQFKEPTYIRLCAEIKQDLLFHRKQWEYIYILRALEQYGMMQLG